MTHRQAAAFGSPVFRICGPAPPAYSPCLSSARSRFVRRDPPDLVHHQPSRQISDHREARPPARRPRRELRSARRLGVIGLYVLLVG